MFRPFAVSPDWGPLCEQIPYHSEILLRFPPFKTPQPWVSCSGNLRGLWLPGIQVSGNSAYKICHWGENTLVMIGGKQFTLPGRKALLAGSKTLHKRTSQWCDDCYTDYVGSHQEKKDQEAFYNPQKGVWQPHADELSEYKLESSFTTTTNFLVENRLLRRNPRGGWDIVMDAEAAQLPASQRGHFYSVKRVFVDGREYLSVKSLRFIDDEALQVLQGLTVLGRDAKPVHEPQLLRQEFLLSSEEEETFLERLRMIGGEISRGKSSLKQMYEKLQRLSENYRAAKQHCTATEKIMQKITQGVMIDAPTIDQHGEATTNAYREATRLLEQVLEDAKLIAAADNGVTDKGKAIAYQEYAENVYEKIEQLHRLQRSYEAQVATRLGDVFSDKLPSVDMPETSRKLLLAPVVEYYLQRGFNCALTDKGMVLRVRDYVITLGDKVTIKSPGAAGAEQEGTRAQKRQVREI